MATNTAGHVARLLPFQAVHYLKMTVNYNDTNISTGIPFAAYLPGGAQILFTTVNVLTAFNAATTNVLTVGQNATSYNDIVNAGDVNEGATGSAMVLRGADLDLTAADALPYIKYAQTGTAATAGKAVIVIAYAPSHSTP